MSSHGWILEEREEYIPEEWADAVFAGEYTQWDLGGENKIPLEERERPRLARFLRWARTGGWKLEYGGDGANTWGTSRWAAYTRPLVLAVATRRVKAQD